MLQAQLEVENAQILVENALNRHAAAWQQLVAVAGQPQLHPQPLAGNAFAPACEVDYHEALIRLQTTSPEVAAAVMAVNRARASYDRAEVEPVPNVTVEGLMNVIDNGIGGKPDAGITVSSPVPIFNRNHRFIQQAQHEIVVAQRALQQLELQLQNRLAPTYERYANARSQVQRYQTAILPAASESLELTRKMYEAGETGYVDLLVAQRTFFQTNLNYLESLRSLRVAEAEIEGLLLSGSLQSN